MLDTSGFSCPEPVIMTKKALKDRPASLDDIVDNVESRENVPRYAEAVGYNVKRTDKDGKWILSLTR